MGPIAVFPDLENKTQNAFLMVKGLSEWADGFSWFLNEAHSMSFGNQLLQGEEEKASPVKDHQGIHDATHILKSIPEDAIIAI